MTNEPQPASDAATSAKPAGPYTPAIRAGDWLIVSGQIGAVDGKLVDGGFVAEMRQALAGLRQLLETNGATMHDVVKTTVFLDHQSDYGRMNELYCEGFGDHRPARSAVAVAELPLGALVEIDAWAYLG